MRKLFFALAALLLSATASFAGVTTTGAGKVPTGGGGGYVGPGDIAGASGAGAFYSVRAYTAAQAASGTAKALNVIRASDSQTCDILLASTGDLGNVTACSSSATGAASTFCNATTCSVVSWYDLSGNAVTQGQSTGANQPTLVFGCVNGKPCVVGNGSQYLINQSSYGPAQPLTVSAVAIRTGATGTQSDIVSGANGIWFDTSAAVGGWFGGAATVSASNTAWHAMQFGVNGGASASNINVDGTNTAVSFGTGALSSDYELFAQQGATDVLTGKIAEVGIWGSLLSGTVQTNLCHNQAAYFGISATC